MGVRMRSAMMWTAAAVAGVAVGAGALVANSGRSAAKLTGSLATGVYLDRPEDVGPDSALTYRRVVDAGATLDRFTISWRDIAPAELPKRWQPTDPGDPHYRWGDLDAKVESSVGRHLQPMITVLTAPQWAQVGGTPQDPSSSYQPDPAALAQFTTAITRRYSGSFHGLPRVRYWEAWNEPNITAYLEPQWKHGRDASPTWYRRMVNAFADAAHATKSDNVVIAGGLSPFTVNYPTVKSIGPLRFMRELLCMSAGAHPEPTCSATLHFDIWDHHPYTTGGPFHHAARPDDVSLGDLPKMQALLSSAADAGHISSNGKVRFWVTEFSWDSNPPDPAGVPVLLERRWVAEALYQMWRSGVSAAFWLLLRDDPYPAAPLQSGLYFRGATVRQDKPKPMVAAFRFPFVGYLRSGSISFWGRLPASRAGSATLELGRGAGGPWRSLTTVKSDENGIFHGSIRTEATASDWVRAVGAGSAGASPPFSLTPARDRFFHPFG